MKYLKYLNEMKEEEDSNQKLYRKWIEDNIDRLYNVEHLDGNEQIADACLMMFGVSLNSKDGRFIEEISREINDEYIQKNF